MLSNKTKRNIWLTLSVLSALTVIDRSIRLAMGEIDWWKLAFSIIVTALCVKFYLAFRKQVKKGNLFGHVNPLEK